MVRNRMTICHKKYYPKRKLPRVILTLKLIYKKTSPRKTIKVKNIVKNVKRKVDNLNHGTAGASQTKSLFANIPGDVDQMCFAFFFFAFRFSYVDLENNHGKFYHILKKTNIIHKLGDSVEIHTF